MGSQSFVFKLGRKCGVRMSTLFFNVLSQYYLQPLILSSGKLWQMFMVHSQVQKWAVAENTEASDMIIYFKSIRPHYSRAQIQSEPADYSTHHFLLCLLLSRGLPMLSSITAKDQVFFSIFPKASPGHPCLCFPSGACDATCCGIHADGTMKL